MKMIKLKKFDVKEINVLKNATFYFLSKKNTNLRQLSTNNPNEFLNRLLLIDISQRLFYFFRGKTESLKTEFSLSFSISEAIVMMQICDEFGTYLSDEFYQHTLRQAKELIFNEIINL